MAKAAKKKSKPSKKAARVTAKPKAAAKSAKPAKKKAAKAASPSRPAARKTAPKIDPLNRKNYGALTPMLAVSDVRRAADFYTRAFGFKSRGIMDSPQGAIHAELRLRDTTLMLSPESRQQNNLSANSIGNTPATFYILVDDVDSTFTNAVAAGAKVTMPVMDMFWGDRCGQVSDPDGNKWMIATHKAEPTEAEMAAAMKQMMEASQTGSQNASAATAGAESEY
ncbi:MAG TPA: VOC family protein [Terriglobia bacterium]|nr:VOC family protein [Terriglobia bacterium]